METGIFEPEKDLGKAQFQQELNRWFESRGIIADLRLHLRHLMITALQDNQVGLKAHDRNSPKAQALSLMMAEYLFRRGCHYTLSVFTSEVPSLVNFNPEGVLQGGKPAHSSRKYSRGICFEEGEVEEIFNALGMSSQEEELALVKSRYFEKGNETSLIELFLQTVVEMAMKLQIRRDLESHTGEGERLLSKKWSSRVINVLIGEKLTPEQVTVVEQAIFRITESEIRRISEEERRLRLKMLSEREKRIQEYLRRHENEIFSRLMEAESELATRKDLIAEELAEREKHLTEMAVEWNNKHEEILRLSKNFHNIENENRNLQKKLKDLEEDNKNLEMHGEKQTKTIEDLRGEMNLLKNKLKEVTDTNSALNERIQVLINGGNKETFVHHESANQETTVREEIPLLWPKKMPLDWDIANRHPKPCSPKRKSKEFTVTSSQITHPDQWNSARVGSGDAQGFADLNSPEDVASLSSSSEEIIPGLRKKLQDLEEETNRLQQNYMEFKLKCVSNNSDSESSRPPSAKSLPDIPDEVVTKETKFCQTESKNTFTKILKLIEPKRKKSECDDFVNKKPEVVPQTMTVTRAPTKRQLQNRDFFLKSRQLLQALERQRVVKLQTSPSSMESFTCSSEEEPGRSSRKKSPIKLTPAGTVSICPVEEVKKPAVERKVDESNQIPQNDAECLTLLEEARIKSPVSARMPLRQQILLSESDEEKGQEKNSSKSGVLSPATASFGNVSVGKKSDGSW